MVSHLESRVIPRQVVENIISYGNKRKKEPLEDRPEDCSTKRQHLDTSDHDVSPSSEEPIDQKPPSPQADRDFVHDDAQLPTFTLNQPRLNALRFLDGYGIPQQMNQTVTVRTTYSKANLTDDGHYCTTPHAPRYSYGRRTIATPSYGRVSSSKREAAFVFCK